MEFSITDIVTSVKVALDQNMNSEALITEGDIDTLSMEQIIRSKIEDAAKIVTSIAPHHLLDGGKTFGESIGWQSSVGYGRGYIFLPQDFLRLVCFQMSDWSYPVFTPITSDDPKYRQQFSRHAGIKGNPQRPVVAITPIVSSESNPSNLMLEFFSCQAGSSVYVKQASYIPIPKILDDNTIDLCYKLKSAIVYYIAYMVASSIGNADVATAMLNNSKEFLA